MVTITGSLPLRIPPPSTAKNATMAPKVFVVTGASKGIGAAVAARLLALKHNVVLTARSEDLLAAMKKSHPEQVEYIAGDITEIHLPYKLIERAIDTFGKLDGVVINHGVLEPKRVADVSEDEMKHIYDVNVFSGFAVAKASIEELRKSKGALVWVSSGAATKPYVAWGSYGSSKAAINHLSAHFAAEEPEIISVTVAPGRVNTEMQATLRDQGKETMNKDVYDSFVDAYENDTLLQPEQPGNVIAEFLAEPSKELSGQSVNWNSPELAPWRKEEEKEEKETKKEEAEEKTA